MTGDYYISRKPKLLKLFDKTAKIAKEVFVSRYGAELGNALVKEARREFEAVIPHIPYLGAGAPFDFRLFIIVAALELSVYRAMTKRGRTAEEAWELCHETLKAKLKTIPGFVRWVIRSRLFSSLAKRRMRRLAKRSQERPFGEWAFRFVEGDGENFDWGADYTGCSIYTFMRDQGAAEFAPYVCLSDVAVSDAFGAGLMRTKTLADGHDRCDFRFKRGGKTDVASSVSKPPA